MTQKFPEIDLEQFDIDPKRGFLPNPDPLEKLPQMERTSKWEKIAGDLPKLLAAGKAREVLEKLTHDRLFFDNPNNMPFWDSLRNHQLHRAMLLFSFFGHAYVWGGLGEEPTNSLPKGIAVPWHQIAKELGRPPVLSYASYALHNWKRINPAEPIELGNITLLQNFFGGLDEEWFILVHVDIEAKAGLIPNTTIQALKAVFEDNPKELEKHLVAIGRCQKSVYQTLLRMTDHCDPYIYYNRVRPCIHGWKDNPSLPNGLIYEGVEEYHGVSQQFRGETGAQSSIFPLLDAFLGVEHAKDKFWRYLQEMRIYMPPGHHAFVETVEKINQENVSLRKYVLDRKASHPSLWEAFHICLEWAEHFRSQHKWFAEEYIQKQVARSHNPTDVGTGGTPFIPYLEKHQKETLII